MTETRNLTFLDNLVPKVTADDYTIKVTQTPSGGDIPDGTKFELAQELTVTGLRLRAETNEIHGVYPPAGTAGRFAQYLPHVALERRGVPWERKIASNDDGTTPWLGILLFAPGELPHDPKALGATEDGTAESLLLSEGNDVSLPDFTTVSALTAEEKQQTIATIQVPKAVFTRITPTSAELPLLAHIRTPLGTEQDDTARRKAEYAYVLANRLPDPLGGRYVAHLVSFEGHKALLDDPTKVKDHVRLVSLHHWSFVSAPVEAGAAYTELRANLTRGPVRPHLLQHPGPDGYGNVLDDYTKHIRYLIGTGHVALGHVRAARAGDYAFYRGPLTPYPVARVTHHDRWWEAVEDSFGVKSLGHHTAWALGRGLALADQEFADALARAVDVRHAVVRNLVQIVGGRRAVAAELDRSTLDRPLTDPVGELLPPPERLRLPFEEAFAGAAVDGFGADGTENARALDRVLAGEPPQFHAHAVLAGAEVTGLADDEEEPGIELIPMVRAGDLTFPAATPSATETMAELMDDPRVLRRFAAHVLGHTAQGASAAGGEEAVSADAGGTANPPTAPVAEPTLTSFLNGLRLLKRVPFDHLVPDAKALPPESMRWFRVDPDWLDALVHGALWAGICGSHDEGTVKELVSAYLAASPPTPKSGLLIRSRLVADYPEFGVEPSKEQVLGPGLDSPKVLRRAALSPDILLVLFDGVPKEVHITEPDQGLHLGVATYGGAEKLTLRALKRVGEKAVGDEVPDNGGAKHVPVVFRANSRVLDLKGAGNLLGAVWAALGVYKPSGRAALSPGEFGLQLVRSPEKAVLRPPAALHGDQYDEEARP
ncbi:hypothetical protein [Nocardiopsis quinghaiensis]|uniref:hypothetical protein n=1 Tax=Nocardiopsis quinghaiensis TaxID=464995 RepID=UPI001238B7E7|nr:hypothetical protein [Nocardiopsis quinghaiensis]